MTWMTGWKATVCPVITVLFYSWPYDTAGYELPGGLDALVSEVVEVVEDCLMVGVGMNG